ncbi:GMP synthase [Alginatibacterium sediminis]|uniref:GMP synthase n=1 Tax=Alginatibacterium sediminis TaxID=2164068 RepID=A0A420EH01_9ALTE|nr:GMP synthase [Alginatibacterium sediminis]RKF19944.1 GMP synthase [Alginatibacterium sediminis]
MRVALLLCDDIRAELQNEFGNYPESFANLFEAAGCELEIHTFRVLDGKYPSKLDLYDAFITSGSKFGVNDELDWIRELEKFVFRLHQEQRVLIGICFGHQLIAKVLGGLVEQANQGWGVGVHSSKFYSKPAWIGDAKDSFDLLVSHQDQVTHLPNGASTLAGSDFCPNSLVQFSPRFLGVQGHPEFTADYSRALIKLRSESYSQDVMEQGLKSTYQHIDSLLLARAIINFIAMQTT